MNSAQRGSASGLVSGAVFKIVEPRVSHAAGGFDSHALPLAAWQPRVRCQWDVLAVFPFFHVQHFGRAETACRVPTFLTAFSISTRIPSFLFLTELPNAKARQKCTVRAWRTRSTVLAGIAQCYAPMSIHLD